MTVKLYANWVSQPCRAVGWVLKIKNGEHEYITTDFGGPVINSEEFAAMNPNKFVPVIKDDDFVLYEGNAILTYLADKFEWTDLYPTDRKARAKIDQYLHWHHTGARLFTIDIVRPLFRKALHSPLPGDEEKIAKTDEVFAKVTSLLEQFLVKDYIAQSDVPTLADYACYCEVDQLITLGFDFTSYPKVNAWIGRMKEIAYHDEVRVALEGVFGKLGMTGSQKKSPETKQP